MGCFTKRWTFFHWGESQNRKWKAHLFGAREHPTRTMSTLAPRRWAFHFLFCDLSQWKKVNLLWDALMVWFGKVRDIHQDLQNNTVSNGFKNTKSFKLSKPHSNWDLSIGRTNVSLQWLGWCNPLLLPIYLFFQPKPSNLILIIRYH